MNHIGKIKHNVSMIKDQNKRSSCPVSCALDILGDKWTLLVIRDILFKDKQHFRDFLASPEKIASNILSDRLKKLEECNIISRQRDPLNARRVIYTLTEKGKDLSPALHALIHWGAKYDPESNKQPCSLQHTDRMSET